MESRLHEVEERIGHRFGDVELLRSALTHASALPRGVVRIAERLEFLGDAVLDLAIADLLLKRFPEVDEGTLSKSRSRLVCTETLARKAYELGLGEALSLGRGEERSGGRNKDSILAATYEAVLGGVFQDVGFHRARAVVRRHFRRELSDATVLEERDWKTLLQERTQARARVLPQYVMVGESGPAHARRFRYEVYVQGRRLACGEGGSKREAEQSAAERALSLLAEESTNDK